ncbi:tumor necrosis factor receptor superfamily member 27 isoform X1 [Podarcis lilfordi]|uniref:Tumor necrosis factor receptor superfamily member 27 isoform X1 n=1 Tax=Podarcis lilfordi TaxID=74358 RepID=A0AA35LCQ6_9SAUR|nr:tumor necrosis factor receptor superfamily member 27 isoform X1 [Podarcis lilfordi]
MKKEVWLMLMVAFVANVPQLPANPLKCKQDEYLDDQGRCSPCLKCGPGTEPSKECGYGEGGSGHCVPCPPRRFKNNLSHLGCKPCVSCSLLNRIQRHNCSSILNAACGECYPGFYRKIQIGGERAQECIPCTRRTPSSELDCDSEESVVPVKYPIPATQDLLFVVLTLTTFIITGLALVTVTILYCKRIWKNHCQHACQSSQDLSDQEETFQDSAMSAAFPCRTFLSNSFSVAIKRLSPWQRPQEGLAEAVHFVSRVPGVHRPFQEPDRDFVQVIPASNQAPLGRSLAEHQHFFRDSGYSDYSLTDLRQDCGAAPSGPPVAPVSSCATERLDHWPHAPVECTELDLQNLSTQADVLATIREENHHGEGAAEAGSSSGLELNPTTPECPACRETEAWLAPQSFSSFQNLTVESREQPESDVWNLVAKTDDATQGEEVCTICQQKH